MSTTIRVVITCDGQRSTKCLGLLEFGSPDVRHIPQTHRRVTEAGWGRGYGATQTYDVCPACRPLMQQEARTEVPAGPEDGSA